MNQPDRKITPHTVAFIQARWHADIVDEARKGFLGAMEEPAGAHIPVDVLDVPGAFEIPLLAKRLAASGAYAAIVGAAFVVDGGIYRHDFVARTVVSALMRVQLETGVPVLSVVLTPHNFQETAAHRAFFLSHFDLKGREAAAACRQVWRYTARWRDPRGDCRGARLALERFRFSSNRESTLSPCFHAIPDGKPLTLSLELL